MAEESVRDNRPMLKRVAALVSEALDLLDAHGGPADVAAHLDLALTKLRQEIAGAQN